MPLVLTTITAPAAEPVSLTEAKLHCRVDISTDDDLITGLIQAARELVEAMAWRALVSQTLEYVLEEWPGTDEMILPRPPLQSVTSITYKDSDAATNTFSSDSYDVDTDREPGKVVLLEGESWPSETLYSTSPIRVRFVAGYGDAADVPQKFRQAILLLVSHFYEHRDAADKSMLEIPFGVKALVDAESMRGF